MACGQAAHTEPIGRDSAAVFLRQAALCNLARRCVRTALRRMPGAAQMSGFRPVGPAGLSALSWGSGGFFPFPDARLLPCGSGSKPLPPKTPLGGLEGRSPPNTIRSGGVYAARSGSKPLPLSCSGRALCAQEHDVPFAARLRSEKPSTRLCRRSAARLGRASATNEKTRGSGFFQASGAFLSAR